MSLCWQVKRLIENGVDASSSDQDKRAALHLSAAEGHDQVVDYLLASKASAESCDVCISCFKEFSFQYFYGSLWVLTHSSQANVNCVDRWGRTPLQDALTGDHSSCGALLRGKGFVCVYFGICIICLCIYVYPCVCIYIHMYIHVYLCIYMLLPSSRSSVVCAYILICLCIHIYTSVHIYSCTYILICIHIHMCACTYTYIYTCIRTLLPVAIADGLSECAVIEPCPA